MPIHKKRGKWFWGSQGPFDSREKALEVQGAAYAHGWREHKSDDPEWLTKWAGVSLDDPFHKLEDQDLQDAWQSLVADQASGGLNQADSQQIAAALTCELINRNQAETGGKAREIPRTEKSLYELARKGSGSESIPSVDNKLGEALTPESQESFRDLIEFWNSLVQRWSDGDDVIEDAENTLTLLSEAGALQEQQILEDEDAPADTESSYRHDSQEVETLEITQSSDSPSTGCVSCTDSHWSTVSGILNEAVRFARRGTGFDSHEVLGRIRLAKEELNVWERWDVSPVRIANTPEGVRKVLSDMVLKGSELRHMLHETGLAYGGGSLKDLENAAKTASEIAEGFQSQLSSLGLYKSPAAEGEEAQDLTPRNPTVQVNADGSTRTAHPQEVVNEDRHPGEPDDDSLAKGGTPLDIAGGLYKSGNMIGLYKLLVREASTADVSGDHWADYRRQMDAMRSSILNRQDRDIPDMLNVAKDLRDFALQVEKDFGGASVESTGFTPTFGGGDKPRKRKEEVVRNQFGKSSDVLDFGDDPKALALLLESELRSRGLYANAGPMNQEYRSVFPLQKMMDKQQPPGTQPKTVWVTRGGHTYANTVYSKPDQGAPRSNVTVENPLTEKQLLTLEDDWQVVSPGEVGQSAYRWLKANFLDTLPEGDDRHVYHGTSGENVESIASKGLMPVRGEDEGSNPGLSGRVGKVFVAPDIQEAAYQASIPWQLDLHEGKPTHLPVILRIRLDSHEFEGTDDPREMITHKKVDPEKIEIWDSSRWTPIISRVRGPKDVSKMSTEDVQGLFHQALSDIDVRKAMPRWDPLEGQHRHPGHDRNHPVDRIHRGQDGENLEGSNRGQMTIEAMLGADPLDVIPRYCDDHWRYFQLLQHYVDLANPDVNVPDGVVNQVALELKPRIDVCKDTTRKLYLQLEQEIRDIQKLGSGQDAKDVQAAMQDALQSYNTLDTVAECLESGDDRMRVTIGLDKLFSLENSSPRSFYAANLYGIQDGEPVRQATRQVLQVLKDSPRLTKSFAGAHYLGSGEYLLKAEFVEISGSPSDKLFENITVISKSEVVKEEPIDVYIAGYASPVVKDKEGHRIPLPALKEAFKKFMKYPEFRNVMIKHRNAQVATVVPEYKDKQGRVWKSQVDDIGMFVVCKLRTDVKIARDVIDLIKRGLLRSFSIGGEALARKYVCDSLSCWWDVTGLDLHEVTICEEGKNQGAKFILLKSTEEIPSDSGIDTSDFTLSEKEG